MLSQSDAQLGSGSLSANLLNSFGQNSSRIPYYKQSLVLYARLRDGEGRNSPYADGIRVRVLYVPSHVYRYFFM